MARPKREGKCEGCKVDFKEKPHHCRGLCKDCYANWKYWADPKFRETRRKRNAEYHRKRYNTDPEYRARNIKKTKEWYKKHGLEGMGWELTHHRRFMRVLNKCDFIKDKEAFKLGGKHLDKRMKELKEEARK